MHVTEDHVKRPGPNDERDLLEADAAHVRGKRDVGVPPDEAHPLDAPSRILAELDVVLVHGAQGADARLNRPGLVWIDTNVPHGRTALLPDPPYSFNLARGFEDPVLQLDVSKAVLTGQLDGMLGYESRIAVVAFLRQGGVPVEHIGRELDLLVVYPAP